MGDGWTIWPQKYGEQKAVFSHEKGFHSVACKNRLDSGTGLVNPVTAARRRRLSLPYPEARDYFSMANPGRRQPPWSVAEGLGTGRLPGGFVGAL